MQSQLGSCNSLTPAPHPLTTRVVLVVYNIYCYYQAAVLGNGSLWPGLSQTRGALPIPTNAGDQTKNHRVLHVESPTNPYQLYRDPVLAVRNPLVHLAWSWNPYQALPKHRSGWASILM